MRSIGTVKKREEKSNEQHKMMEVSLGTNGQHEAMDLHVKGILEAHQYEKAMLSICAVPPMNKPQKRKSLIKSIFCCDETKKAMSDLAQMMRRQAG